jgi:starch-binding outer membrane protein, SusD/RagB family
MAPEMFLQGSFVEGSDTASDVRWRDKSTLSTLAINLGFIYGQQYDISGDSLFNRDDKTPLSFTFECPLEGAAENQGVRVVKYAPRVTPINVQRTANDFIIWRYAESLLMKAECLARTGSDYTVALNLVNTLRVKRNAPEISASSSSDLLTKILTERGAELYWEGHRRQDQIRFGTFLLSKTNKDYTSPETAILLPIPQNAIDVMAGALIQNPGY